MRRSFLIALMVTAAATAGARAFEGPGPRRLPAVDPAVLAATDGAGETEFLVVTGNRPDLSGAAALADKAARGRWVMERLQAAAERSQGPLLARLRAAGVEHRPLWIANAVWARGDRAALELAMTAPGVVRIEANPEVRLAPPEVVLTAHGVRAGAAVEWGVDQVGAPAAWSAGLRGQGVVVAGQDTGYDWEHPALRDAYRGWDGASAVHDYNWWDAVHSGGGGCGADSPVPCDDGSHGTHTMGTIVGAGGIGVAPDARWIGCRNMDRGFGTPARYLECFQFFLAPTDLTGADPRPDLAPDVINNSWGCPAFEGCTDPEILEAAVDAVRAAGIAVVVSAGNSGPACGTVTDPPAIYDGALTVAALDALDQVAGFSSRGPVTAVADAGLKPDVAAPGVMVRSSVPGGGYAMFSGTSMAAPHVTGVLALLLSARPDLKGQVDVLEDHLRATALPVAVDQTCAGVAPLAVPNGVTGYGRVQVQPDGLPPAPRALRSSPRLERR